MRTGRINRDRTSQDARRMIGTMAMCGLIRAVAVAQVSWSIAARMHGCERVVERHQAAG